MPVLSDRNNNLNSLRLTCLAKLKEQFNVGFTEQQAKNFVFCFAEKQIESEFEEINFATLIDKNMLNVKEFESTSANAQLEFRLICNNLDIEADLIKNTIVKTEEKSSSFKGLVRMLDETGKLWNGIATVSKHGQGNYYDILAVLS